MKSIFIKTAAAAAVCAIAASAQAVVLNFDDLGPGRVYLDVYGGLDFSPAGGAGVSNWFVTDTVDPYNPPASAPSYVGTTCGIDALPPSAACGTANVDSDRVVGLVPFKMNSVFLGGSDPVQIPPAPILPLAVTFKLYNAANTLVHTEAFSVNSGFNGSSAQFFFTYASPVSSFVVTSKQGFYALDNLDITPIPEAGTLAMMLAGLAAVGAVTRRKQAR